MALPRAAGARHIIKREIAQGLGAISFYKKKCKKHIRFGK
jgi:hypothetical protein